MKEKPCDEKEHTEFDLTVLPVKKENHGLNIRRPVHPLLPDIGQGASTIICSSVRSGKSNLLVNLILNPNFFRDAFTDVYVFSSTLYQDQTSKKLLDAFPATCYDSFDERKLQRILDHQKSFEDEDRPAIAIILDDLQGIKAKSLFFTIATSFRHFGASLFYVVQNFKMIPPIVRSNATNLFIGTNNSHQLKQVALEYSGSYGGEDNFLRYHALAVPERYNFLYCRLDVFPCTMHKNFEEKAIYEDEM